MSYKRIISLLPSSTEILVGLGALDLLKGISHECDYPEEIKALPVCSYTDIPKDISSKEIDDLVHNKVLESLSIYSIDWEKIKAIQPDLIITQDQCEVCAVHIDELKDSLKLKLGYEPALLSFHSNNLEEVFDSIRVIASCISLESKANQWIEDMQERVELIKHKVKFVKQRPNIAMIEWMDPLMVAGHWTPGLLEIAGGNPIISEAEKKSTYIKLDDLINAEPDGIIIAACGFDLKKSLEEYATLAKNDDWQKLKAVQKGQVFICDGNAFFNRPGPRLVETSEMLAEILQMNQFYYGMEGEAWVQVEVKSE